MWAVLVTFAVSGLATSLWAQEEAGNPITGTIQGTLRDEDGNAVQGAKVFYNSSETDVRGVTRSGKDGKYVSEVLPPGPYVVRAVGRNFLPAESKVAVVIGSAVTADFRLESITPGPAQLENKFTGEIPDTLPINGRNYLSAAQLELGVQTVDGVVLDPGKSGFQSLSIDSLVGRTTHYDQDEVEVMDETKGLATLNLPAEAVREVVVSRVTPEVFQSLNAAGAVRVSTRSGGEQWHGNLFGDIRDQALGLAGFAPGPSDYSRQQYGFGAGGALLKSKAFLFLSGERTKQDGLMPAEFGFPCTGSYISGLCGVSAADQLSLQSAFFRENMLTARLDYNISENMKGFVRLSYDNSNQIAPSNSQSNLRTQFNVPTAVAGVDWNHGRFVNSARFGYEKLVDAVNPALADSAAAPFHLQIGSYALGPSIAGPRQTIQQDLFARYDGSTSYSTNHTARFGGSVHRIAQGDFYAPGNNGPSVTSSNGMDVIDAINATSSLFPLLPGDPRGAADNPLNYPVGTITIFNGLGNFSGTSAFNRPTGGHFDTRVEAYVSDNFNLFPNLNLNLGVNYVRDNGRTDSDLAPLPCTALNPALNLPCTGLILDQFNLVPPNSQVPQQSIGGRIRQPNLNFAPQVGLAWDPGHNGRTLVRVSGGLFYDNFLLQNTYQDRINRLSNGQYNRSLTLCPAGAVLFPDGSLQSKVDGLDIATQICGQPIGSVSTEIQHLESQFLAAQSSATGANVYSLANSLGNFGGLLAPTFKTPRVVHLAGGIQHQFGSRGLFSADYVREIGTQFPLGIDTNRAGDATYMTDGDFPQQNLNTYAAELAAINATIAANPFSANAGCPQAQYAGASSQAAVTCYLSAVPTASITDFAHYGLDSSNAFCGPFPCSVVGKPQASFGGINPAVGSNVMYFPAGQSRYTGVHLAYSGATVNHPLRRVERFDLAIAYTLSRYRTNIAEPDGSGGDYSRMNVATDYNRPHVGNWGDSGLDRTHQLTLTPTAELAYGFKVSAIIHLASPLPLSALIPQQDGGGVAGEIFRSDVTGDGTVGDLLPHTIIGSTGKYSNGSLTKVIKYYDTNIAGQLTPAGQALANAQLFSQFQLHQLGAYAPLVQALPTHAAEETWLKTMDLHLSRPFQVSERVRLEPNFSVFNVFNWANFGGPGGQLSGVLNAAPGSSLNNASSGGFCGTNPSFCNERLDRVLPGSGTYSTGAPRQLEFGLRIVF